MLVEIVEPTITTVAPKGTAALPRESTLEEVSQMGTSGILILPPDKGLFGNILTVGDTGGAVPNAESINLVIGPFVADAVLGLIHIGDGPLPAGYVTASKVILACVCMGQGQMAIPRKDRIF